MQSVTRKVTCIFFSICCVLLGAAAVQAQLLEVSIRLKAEAVNVSGALVWQVNMQFSPTDVVIDESTIAPQLNTQCPQVANTIRTRILNELTRMAEQQTNRPFFIDSFPGNNYSLPPALQPQAFFGALSSQLNQSNSTESIASVQSNTTHRLHRSDSSWRNTRRTQLDALAS